MQPGWRALSAAHRLSLKCLPSSVGLLLAGRGVCRLVLVCHEALELVEVDPAVAVEVGLLDHGAHLAVRQRLPEVVHRQLQLLLRYEAVAVTVKHPEARFTMKAGRLKRIRTENATRWSISGTCT